MVAYYRLNNKKNRGCHLMHYTQDELQDTLSKMQALISKAQDLAEPILTRWDGEDIQNAINQSNMSAILKNKESVAIPLVSTHHSANGRP
jgi:hypothetical protein